MNDTNNYTMRQRMLDASISAYAITYSDGIHFDPDHYYWDPIRARREDAIAFTDGESHIDAGFVVTTEDQWVVLALRGTLSTFDSWDTFLAFLEDWLQDDDTKPVPMMIGGETIGRVNKGFLDTMIALWPDIKRALDGVNWSKVKGVQITGHSKGGGATFIAAAMVRAAYPEAREIKVHAFAAPLAGQPDFAVWYRDQQLDISTTRYQRMYDFVPFVPPSAAWDIFDNLGWPKSFEGTVIEAALKALSLTLYGGYQELGTLVFLPNPPESSTPVVGAYAPSAAQHAILHAVEYGQGKEIASAHSAKDSYWPALFREAPPGR